MHSSKIKKLIHDLSNDDASVRRSAAEGLAEADDRAVYPLIKALRDSNLGVQDAAMQSLMTIKGEYTAYMVLPLLREDALLRNTALIILREIGNETVPLLVHLLKDRDDDIRKFAVDLIHDIGTFDYPEKLADLLQNDTNSNVRASAAKALGVLNYREALPQLLDTLRIKVDDEWVAFSALEALAKYGNDFSVYPVIALLSSSSDALRFAAIETLGSIGSKKAGPALIDIISRTEGYEKKAAIKSLILIGDITSAGDVSDDLIEMLSEDDWDEKLTAVMGLTELGEKKAVHQIIDLAGSLDSTNPENEDMLYIIKESLRRMDCTDELINIINDPSFKYRGKSLAIELLGELNCVEAVPALIGLLKNGFRDIKRSTIKSLSNIESDESMEIVMESLSDSDSHVRKTAVITLGRTGDDTAFEPLMNLLKKEDYADIVYEIVGSLIRINSHLLFSRIGEFGKGIQDTIKNYASEMNLEVKC